MALTLNAEQKSIYDIFSGVNQYIIPPYQRAYSWTNVQCKALFEDIKKAFYSEEQEGYFLGNMVLAKSRNERNRLEVIDGQQRLTTLILLIKVLLSFDKENKALYNAIWIKDRRTDKEIQKLQTDIFMEQDFNYFKEVLAFDFSDNICESINKEDNLFKQNICYFYNELKEFNENNDIYKFSDFLLDNISLLVIETENSNPDKSRKNALQIFETINNRGLNLSTSDIFKARLYSMALNKLKHDDFIKKWKKLYEKSKKINYTIDEVFEIYSYTIQIEKGLEPKKQELREFFLYNNNSVFSNKEYEKIINNLFKIVDFIEFFKYVLKNSNKYSELSKWFQLVDQGHNHFHFNIKYFFAYISQNNLKNHGELIEICKKFIVNNKRIQEISKKDPKRIEQGFLQGIYLLIREDFFVLLSLYIDSNTKAIYPYYNERITIDNLIELKLIKNKDDEYLVEFIKRANKFIREYNEN